MQRIKISEFKLMIESATGKKVHKTTFTRYKEAGLVPKTKKGAKQLNVDADNTIKKIIEYESQSHSEKVRQGLDNAEYKKVGGLAFALMNSRINKRKGDTMCRLISKQRNRRMYDLETHTFTTMDKLHDLAKSGIEFKVMEVATNRDITRAVLLELLITDDEILTTDILKELIFCSGDNFKSKLSSILRKSMKDFSENKCNYSLIN